MANFGYTAFELTGTAGDIDAAKLTDKTLAVGAQVYSTTGQTDIVLGGGTNTFVFDGATFTYEGTASFGGPLGFIAYDANNGHLYFFTANSGPLAPNPGTTGSKPEDFKAPQPGQTGNPGEFNTGTDSSGCFLEGMKIETAYGAVEVQNLKAGDLVMTHGGGFRPVRWVGFSTVSLFTQDQAVSRPIRIRAGALGANVPVRDLLVSPGHGVLVGDVLAHAGALVNGVSIVVDDETPLIFRYFHVELDAHDLVMAEGAPAESFIECVREMNMDNWSDRPLVPGEAPKDEMPYPRVKSPRQVPAAARQILLERADAIQAREVADA